MPINAYFFGLKISTAIVFFAWTMIVLYVNPEESGVLGKTIFFMTFFLWLFGFSTLLASWIHDRLAGEHSSGHILGRIMRRSIFISAFSVILLLLQYFKVLMLWNVLFVVVAFLLLELYFVHNASQRRRESSEGDLGNPHVLQH